MNMNVSFDFASLGIVEFQYEIVDDDNIIIDNDNNDTSATLSTTLFEDEMIEITNHPPSSNNNMSDVLDFNLIASTLETTPTTNGNTNTNTNTQIFAPWIAQRDDLTDTVKKKLDDWVLKLSDVTFRLSYLIMTAEVLDNINTERHTNRQEEYQTPTNPGQYLRMIDKCEETVSKVETECVLIDTKFKTNTASEISAMVFGAQSAIGECRKIVNKWCHREAGEAHKRRMKERESSLNSNLNLNSNFNEEPNCKICCNEKIRKSKLLKCKNCDEEMCFTCISYLDGDTTCPFCRKVDSFKSTFKI